MATFNYELERDGKTIDVIVHYTYHKAYRGATDGRYGPPLEPDEPAHIEIDDVLSTISTTEKEDEDIITAIETYMKESADY